MPRGYRHAVQFAIVLTATTTPTPNSPRYKPIARVSSVPSSDEWKELAAHDFKDYRLKVSGLVENPVKLSLDEIRAMGKQTQVTLHHCIQGWSGIAEWGGLPMAELIKLVRP